MNTGSKHLRGRSRRPAPPPTRSSMNIRLREEHLTRSDVSALERLLAFIWKGGGCPTRRTYPDGSSEPEGAWKHRLVHAILRREKQFAQGQD